MIITLAILLLSGGCAPVKFYSDPGLSKPSGLKYYSVKPYLLVEREVATGNVTKTNVFYLPDLENPQYILMRDGIGSRKADIKLENGSITDICIASESGIPESIASLAALTDKTAEALKDLSSLKGAYPGAVLSTVTELYEFLMKNNTTTLKKIEIN